LRNFGYAFYWQLDQNFSLRAAFNEEEIAPPSAAITDAVVVLDGVRAFDFVRQESVLTRYISGGNPDLEVERRKTTTISATYRPPSMPDLSLDAEYSRIIGRNAFAALPPINADVQAAFPDRFVRDASDTLVSVDARPVLFSRVAREQLRWGANFSRTFGSASQKASGREEDMLLPGWRINAFFTHQWTLESTRQARASLPLVDLLDGGAVGYGGGQPEHLVQFGAGLVHKGFGLQLNGDWRSGTHIATGTPTAPDELRYSAQAQVNARLFANLGPLFPESKVTRGMRLSLEVDNMLDSKQRVRDSSGATPARFQPYLLDPLGRTVRFAIRKVF
jgi:outer membrane receptor protein involved in Fe transport